MSYDVTDFSWPGTLSALYEKVVPELGRVIQVEMETILGCVDVTSRDIQEAMQSAEVIKTFLCSYVEGAAAMICIHQAGFYGDESAKEEILGRSENLREGGIKDVAEFGRKFLPIRFLPECGKDR